MSSPPRYRGRFAPTPNGPLHLGSLLAALGSWLLARSAGGEWWVRMEDLDPPREVAGAAEQQLATLAAMGLHSDAAVAWQSLRGAHYAQALDQLLAEGKAFACHCSRQDLAASAGIHRSCVPRKRRPDPAIRLRVADATVITFEDALQGRVTQDVASEVGDFVLRRADGPWAYQLAVVVDDAAQGMSHVVRGADLLDSTPRQILLQQALGLPTPRYLHLPVVVDAGGHKLSKSSNAPALSIDEPVASLAAAWHMLGQDSAALGRPAGVEQLLQTAAHAFQAQRLPRRAAVPVAAPHNAGYAKPV